MCFLTNLGFNIFVSFATEIVVYGFKVNTCRQFTVRYKQAFKLNYGKRSPSIMYPVNKLFFRVVYAMNLNKQKSWDILNVIHF